MLTRTSKIVRTSACPMVLFAAVAAGLWTGASRQALAGKSEPSPFAGHYGCNSDLDITIDKSGHVDGEMTDFLSFDRSTMTIRGTVSETVSETGLMQLRVAEDQFSTFPDYQTRGNKIHFMLTGPCALDADGNLYGVLYYESGAYFYFSWPRCD